MRPSRVTTLERLRRSSWAAWLAGVLLLFQVVLVTDHLGASAAAAFGPTAEDRAVGLLSLCHVDGSVIDLADGEKGPEPGLPVQPCVLCAVASLSSVAVQAVAPEVSVPAPQSSEVPLFSAIEALPTRPELRYGTERGPPASPVARLPFCSTDRS